MGQNRRRDESLGDTQRTHVGNLVLRLQFAIRLRVVRRETSAAEFDGTFNPAEASVEPDGGPSFGFDQFVGAGVFRELVEHRDVVGTHAPLERCFFALQFGRAVEEGPRLPVEFIHRNHRLSYAWAISTVQVPGASRFPAASAVQISRTTSMPSARSVTSVTRPLAETT